MSPGLAPIELLGIAALAGLMFFAALFVLAWAYPLDDCDEHVLESKLVRRRSLGEPRHLGAGADAVQYMCCSSSACGSSASRCSSSPTIRCHTPHEMEDLQRMEELETKRIDLSWASFEQENNNNVVTCFAQSVLVSAACEEPPGAQEQTPYAARCKLGEESNSSARLGLSRERRGFDKVAVSSAHSTSPGPRVMKVVAPHDRVRKRVQIARKSRPVFRATSDSSKSPIRGTTSSSPVRDDRRRSLRRIVPGIATT